MRVLNRIGRPRFSRIPNRSRWIPTRLGRPRTFTGETSRIGRMSANTAVAGSLIHEERGTPECIRWFAHPVVSIASSGPADGGSCTHRRTRCGVVMGAGGPSAETVIDAPTDDARIRSNCPDRSRPAADFPQQRLRARFPVGGVLQYQLGDCRLPVTYEVEKHLPEFIVVLAPPPPMGPRVRRSSPRSGRTR